MIPETTSESSDSQDLVNTRQFLHYIGFSKDQIMNLHIQAEIPVLSSIGWFHHCAKAYIVLS